MIEPSSWPEMMKLSSIVNMLDTISQEEKFENWRFEESRAFIWKIGSRFNDKRVRWCCWRAIISLVMGFDLREIIGEDWREK